MKIKFNLFLLIGIFLFCFMQNLFSYNWEFIKGPGNQTAISALEVEGNTVYIGLFDKLYKTEDLGATWVEIKYNDSSYFNNIKAIVKINSDIYVQSAYRPSGPFYELIDSKDNGKSWNNSNTDYNPSFYYCLTKNNNQVFTAFYGKSTNMKYLKYNFDTKEWEDIIDSIAKGKINFEPKTIYSFNNKIYFGLDKSQHYIDDKVRIDPGYTYIMLQKKL